MATSRLIGRNLAAVLASALLLAANACFAAEGGAVDARSGTVRIYVSIATSAAAKLVAALKEHFPNLKVDFYQVMTNKAPVGPNRGYSRMQHLWMIERTVDIIAKELGLDPADVRLKKGFHYRSSGCEEYTASAAKADGREVSIWPG